MLGSDEEAVSVQGFVCNLSPMKTSRKNKPYFNMDIETENKQLQPIVCFSPSKRKLFVDAVANNTGCSITNARVSKDKDTVFVTDYTKVKSTSLGFSPCFEVTYHSIHEAVNEIPLDSKVNVRGVLVLGEPQTVKVFGADVPIRNGHICDSSGNIKICLWREYAELENNRTYAFSGLVKGNYNNSVQLQTSSSTTFSEEFPIEDFIPPQHNDEEIAAVHEKKFLTAQVMSRKKCIN